MPTDIEIAYQKALEEYHARVVKEPKKKRGRPPREKAEKE